uniref:Uncharacterized protein n=1 Tax=Vitis vinifera TaxID=29760 RepID=F6H2Z2_VITVI
MKNLSYILMQIAVQASHAALPSEVYWNSVLPNTPVPKAFRDIHQPDFMEDKSTSASGGRDELGKC